VSGEEEVMATYSMSEFDSADVVRWFKSGRANDKARLLRKIEVAKQAEKKLEKYQDDTPEKAIGGRLEKIKQLAQENGITFIKPKSTSYGSSFARMCNTIYEKDKVKITNLFSEMQTHPDGSVCIDVYKIPPEKKPGEYYYYRPRAKDKVIRFFVSENVRITNNVLRSLIATI
jgi:hypothetical protein